MILNCCCCFIFKILLIYFTVIILPISITCYSLNICVIRNENEKLVVMNVGSEKK